jgi:multiple sugar transport system substrate-binding protein
MQAAAALWQQQTGTHLRWESRSLASFGDQPLAMVAGDYDVVIVDHPLVGEAAADEVLVPLDQHFDTGYLAGLADQTVGPSYHSYQCAGHQWALPVDAACQVTAFRPDLMRSIPLPRSWDEVADLALRQPQLVTLPMQSAHALSALCTLCANAGTPVGENDMWLAEAHRAIELLRNCLRGTAARFPNAEPPEILAELAAGNELGYVPLTYGYAGYSSQAAASSGCRFADIPSGAAGLAGATLGGAGLAVPSRSPRREAALRFLQWCCSAVVQREVIAANGGQPAHRAAWEDPAVNARTHGFYTSTRATIDSAWIRPREPWWPYFQRHAGEAIRRGVVGAKPAAAIVAELRSIWETALTAAGPAGQRGQES